MSPYPLVFEPILKPKIWGGDRLRRFDKAIGDDPIGESWELADLAATSPSGGGGGAARSVIVNGPLTGHTLREALERWAGDLIDPGRLTPDRSFPLLVKFLDARQNLSVQVHPSPDYARAHPEAHLKTECWYVLEAEPGALIYTGVRPGVSPAQVEAHIRENSLVDALVAVEARPGDLHLLPSGTVHALGAGVLVAEVQTPSDTTFRLYDWGRTDREIHVRQALEAMIPGQAPAPTRHHAGAGPAELCATEYFAVDAIRVVESHALEATGCCVLMMVQGRGTLDAADRAFDSVPMPRGATVLVPRACARQAVIRVDDPATLLCVRL